MDKRLLPDSIRRIRLDQLEVGMYITELSDHHAVDAGIRSRGLVTRASTIDQFKRMEVSHLFIDISRGADCEGSECVSDLERRQEATLQKLMAADCCLPSVPLEQEMANASRVQSKARALVQGVMQDVKMGRNFDTGAVAAITMEVTASLAANQNALGTLMRVRNMDNYLLEHSTNTAVLMGVLARSMGISGGQLQRLVFGAFVHDIGKVRIPDAILHKPGQLLPGEWEEMKRHVDYGIEALSGIDNVPRIAHEICAQHHERLDGSGYPFKLEADQISSHGRMAAVVDVYDAITADRCYHRGAEPTAALKKMLEWSGHHLERDLVYQLIRCISLYPAGAWVQLSSDKVALVREVNFRKPTRPVVLLVYDEQRACRLDPQIVNLATTDAYGEICAAVAPEPYQLSLSDYLDF